MSPFVIFLVYKVTLRAVPQTSAGGEGTEGARRSPVPVLVPILQCVEGENTPEGIRMATAAAQFLQLFPQEEGTTCVTAALRTPSVPQKCLL